MLYLRICFDKGGSGVREQVLRDHRKYIAKHLGGGDRQPPVRVVQGGPMYAGTQPDRAVGSFLVVEAASLDDVQNFYRNDPFTREGLFERFDIVRWDRHIGNEGQSEYVP